MDTRLLTNIPSGLKVCHLLHEAIEFRFLSMMTLYCGPLFALKKYIRELNVWERIEYNFPIFLPQ